MGHPDGQSIGFARKHPRAIIEFPYGIDGEPVIIFPIGETAEESEAIRELLVRALEVER